MAASKVCPDCLLCKQLSEFYDSERPHADGSPGYSTRCKLCTIAKTAERWSSGAATRQEAEAVRLAEDLAKSLLPRSCRACGIVKPVDDFYSKGTKLSGAKRYRPDCRVCEAAKMASDADLVERNRVKSFDWRSLNPDKAKECSRDSWHKRRAREKKIEGFHTKEDIAVIRAAQNDKCANPYCSIPLHRGGHRDHIIAVSNNGTNWPSNIHLLCNLCNSKKKAKSWPEFLRCYAAEKGLPYPPSETEEV